MIRQFLSARDAAAQLAEQPLLVRQPGDDRLPSVFVNTERVFQTILGFGGAFTEAAAVTWLALKTWASWCLRW